MGSELRRKVTRTAWIASMLVAVLLSAGNPRALFGAPSVTDVCTNTLPSFADRAKVILSKLDTPPGDDGLKLKGRCIPFQEVPTVDPLTNGMRLVMQDNLGNVPLDVLIPGGAYDPATKAGWKMHAFPTGVTAQYKNAGTIVPLIDGIKKMKFVLRSGQGITKFAAIGKAGSYPVGPGGDPVKVTLVANPDATPTTQCCEMLFVGPSPAPACTFLDGGATLRCE